MHIVGEPLTATPPTRSQSSFRALFRAARPRQWVKNVLVFAAPLAAGRLLELPVLAGSLVAFGSFCLVASGIYLLNDARDVEEDRAHPVKRLRPIAAGGVTLGAALVTAAVLLVGGMTLAWALGGVQLLAVMSAYIALNVAYSVGLKNQAVLDLAVVASGFLLRAIAGGVAAGVPLSQWFLLAASFGSLFMVTGKRYSELLLVGPGNPTTRRSLGEYSAGYLRFVWTMSATITLTTYCLWAFEVTATIARPALAQLSIAPFTLGMLRYAVDVERGASGEPEEVVLRDRVLQALALAWFGLFALGAWDGV